MKVVLFENRAHAGRLLAQALMRYAGRDDVIVLGLPRGGVPVAYEVAKVLHAPLDVLVVRKLGMPGNEELAMGAVASGGVRVIHRTMARAFAISEEAIEAAVAEQQAEVRRRELAFRGKEGCPDVADKIVILVDDGMATGATTRAAVEAIRREEPKCIVLAVPTASSDACTLLEPLVDEMIALQTPEVFRAVGQWYEDFSQTSDPEVRELLDKASHFRRPDPHPVT